MTTFTWPYDGSHVALAGTFNDWHPTPMNKSSDGWHLTLDLAPATYEYKFHIDQRRWCYDLLKPNALDDRGCRNNTITVGDGHHVPQSQPQHQAQHQAQQGKGKKGAKEAEAKAPQKSPAPVAEEGEEPKKGKGKGKQQQQKKEDGGKKGGASKVAQAESKKLISTVKSYGVPFYVGDVDCGDSLEDTIATVQLFQAALPEVGLMAISGDKERFIAVAVVPADKTSTLTATHWINTALTINAGAAPAQGTDTLASGTIAANPDQGVFPLKLKDLARGPVFMLLRKLGLVKEESSEDEMYFLDE